MRVCTKSMQVGRRFRLQLVVEINCSSVERKCDQIQEVQKVRISVDWVPTEHQCYKE